MFKILGIDVGTVNSSIVLLIINNLKISKILEFNLNISNTDKIIENMKVLIKKYKDIDYIIIEKQNPKNIKCVQISYSLEMFFKLSTNSKVTLEIPISKRKYNDFFIQPLSNRKTKKNYSLEIAKTRLKDMNYNLNYEKLTHDFADAFNMAYDKFLKLKIN